MLSIHNSLPEISKSAIVSKLRRLLAYFFIIMIVAGYIIYEIKVPTYCFVLLASYLGFTHFLHIHYIKIRKIRNWHIPFFLMSDFIVWFFALAFLGGHLNPLISLLVMPAVFLALYCEEKFVIANIAGVIAGTTLLYFYTPTVFQMPDMSDIVVWYLSEYKISATEIIKLGDIIAISSAAFFAMLSLYIMRREILKYADAQSISSRVYQEYTKAAAIGTMAAAAVHELGTPLNTIHLIATELADDTNNDSPLYDDIKILADQTSRCQTILKKLAKIDYAESNSDMDILGVSLLMEQIAAPYVRPGIRFKVNVGHRDEKDAVKISWLNEWTYAICNVLQNGFQFANSRVSVSLDLVKSRLIVTITDDGKGFSRNILETVGEPYISERETKEKGNHMGLGLFIAKSLIEQTGGTVEFSNNSSGGACVTMMCKLHNQERM